MQDDVERSRLSRIQTVWQLVEQAHADGKEQAQARSEIVSRYSNPIQRYLFAALRDEDAAQEVFQNFWLRFSRGDFRGADPHKGRFRDYLKRALANLIADYRQKRHKQAREKTEEGVDQLAEDAQSLQLDAEFIASWRAELLRSAWERLADAERAAGQPYFAALRFRSDQPESTTEALCAELARVTQREWTSAAARKLLQRARERFADGLLDEVAATLSNPGDGALEGELIELELIEYCRSALRRRTDQAAE